MPIQNKKSAPKASSKTDAMKALTEQSSAAPKEAKKSAVAPATLAITKAPFTQPKPAITRKMPAGIIGRTARDEEPETAAGDSAEAEGKSGGKPKVVFDDMVWQWQELTEDFINTRTGEVRQQNEFTYPTTTTGGNAGGAATGSGGGEDDEWGGAQDGHDEW